MSQYKQINADIFHDNSCFTFCLCHCFCCGYLSFKRYGYLHIGHLFTSFFPTFKLFSLFFDNHGSSNAEEQENVKRRGNQNHQVFLLNFTLALTSLKWNESLRDVTSAAFQNKQHILCSEVNTILSYSYLDPNIFL